MPWLYKTSTLSVTTIHLHLLLLKNSNPPIPKVQFLETIFNIICQIKWNGSDYETKTIAKNCGKHNLHDCYRLLFCLCLRCHCDISFELCSLFALIFDVSEKNKTKNVELILFSVHTGLANKMRCKMRYRTMPCDSNVMIYFGKLLLTRRILIETKLENLTPKYQNLVNQFTTHCALCGRLLFWILIFKLCCFCHIFRLMSQSISQEFELCI